MVYVKWPYQNNENYRMKKKQLLNPRYSTLKCRPLQNMTDECM